MRRHLESGSKPLFGNARRFQHLLRSFLAIEFEINRIDHSRAVDEHNGPACILFYGKGYHGTTLLPDAFTDSPTSTTSYDSPPSRLPRGSDYLRPRASG